MSKYPMIASFDKLTIEQQKYAGGKGGTLARLYQAGYPVPDGFVILPTAFADDKLKTEAWTQALTHLNHIRNRGKGIAFAVRSSALSEDSAQASFAGEFETVLDVCADDDIRAAIHAVRQSRSSERVQAYSRAKGMGVAHEIAVVMQRMVPAEISGVLFTADPITGSHLHMTGNFVHGLGEQLVSGEVTGESFTLQRPNGRYQGPTALKQYGRKLHKLFSRLEKELGGPQDIEWAIANGKLYLLQARPITTLTIGNLDTYDINETLAEDTLWVNTNVAEAIPDIFLPLTWSIIRGFDEELNFIPGYYVWSGNICGRAYSNIGRRASVIATVTGWDSQRILGLLGDLFGQAPNDIHVPIRPLSRSDIIQEILPGLWRVSRHMLQATLTLKRFLRETPDWCREMMARIDQMQTKADLLSLWQSELQPHTIKAWWGHTTGARGVLNIMSLERKLTKLVSKEDANTLLSNLRGDGGLASLGPVMGLSKVLQGEMSREEYLRQYGHRGPHEFELSIPHPAEEPNWLEKQIAEFEKSNSDVDELLKKQYGQYVAARKRFQARYPRKARWLEKQLASVSKGAHLREAARSEFIRVFRVVRAFALRAGELTDIGEDLFFLYIDEVLALLSGRNEVTQTIPARKENYEKYKALPPFPSIIRGRFNPFEWVKNPNRRTDYYDPLLPIEALDSDILTGIAGAVGRVEGSVRILLTPEEGENLQPGEVLVATTTNVGWTLLFPKAAAIITDVGAPLSHAAIVARELGIPAVVGCGNATMRLKTGDRVRVDGGQGVVEILEMGGVQQTDGGKMEHSLQSKPTTRLRGHNSASGEWNDSLTGNYLWSNVNFGEAVTEAMTPLTWTVLQFTLDDWVFLPGYATTGNIGGRPYLNISVFASLFHALRRGRQALMDTMEGTLFMRVPEKMEIPLIPLSRRALISNLPNLVRLQIKQRHGLRFLPTYLATNLVWCRRMQERIKAETSKINLITLWQDEIKPHVKQGVWTVLGTVTHSTDYTVRLRRELTALVGPEDAHVLIANLSDDVSLLPSLGPVVGLAQVARGDLEQAIYLEQYGHRGPHEFEISVPRPAENPDWLNRQIAQFQESPVDVQALLAKQQDSFDATWKRFLSRHPRKAKAMRRRMAESARRARLREEARSEYVRDRWLVRLFALRAGELTGLGDDVFFLTLNELLAALRGDETAVPYIPARRKTYQRYKSLSPYPSLIWGRFHPFQWAADPHRRSDIFDGLASPTTGVSAASNSTITGSPGAAGQVTGLVRRLDRPDDGSQLKQGEILVTGQTDIAWTVLFPRAAAVITDVGAPLSHAAIVARELGIPAVVGCGDATMHLKTGDRVRVDGGRGIVEIIDTGSG